MSVGRKLLLGCLGFVTIIALLGLGARQQSNQLGHLVVDIYDHSFIGATFANRAEAGFLRLISHIDPNARFATPAKRGDLNLVLEELDVAIERANTAHTRDAAIKVRAMLAAFPDVPASRLPAQIAQVDHAIAILVRNYASDGLKVRDRAEDLAERNGRAGLIEVALSFGFAIGLGLLMGRSVGPPLVALVRVIGRLTEGDLKHEVSPRLSVRRDEIGAMARATVFFRATMLRNKAAEEERAGLQAESWTAHLNAERAKAAMTAKSDFLATMSHEIRTPMNGVVTIADLLAETPLSVDQLKMVDIIRQSAKWLLRIINDILDFSKLEANQLHIERIPFMLDDVIDSSLQVLDAKAHEKRLRLSVRGRDLPGICRIGDPLRLRQILLNLLGNAVKFTAEGSVTLDVQASADEVVLSVIDTGIGIPAEKIADLFQPYNQVRSDTAHAYGGTGLGLSITKTLVSLMAGDLAVTSEAGRGSRFTVRLALPSGASSLCKGAKRSSEPAVRWRKPDFATAAAHGAVVLCAEDNAINREVLARVLDRLGFNHDIAEDGQAALSMLDRGRHGMILTDGHMPGVDGWQLTQTIRQQEAGRGLKRLPIILLTADAQSERHGRTIAVGMDAVLTKPLNIDALEAALLGAVSMLGVLRIEGDQRALDVPVKAEAAPKPAAGIDLDILVQLVGDDLGTLSGLLDEFRTSVVAEHELIRVALAVNDASLVARHAHSMKGAARYAGAVHLAEVCDRLEQRAKGSDGLAAMPDDFAALEAAVARLPAEIEAALSRGTANLDCAAAELAALAPRDYSRAGV